MPIIRLAVRLSIQLNPVLFRILQFLNLVAFTAHVVFGCCGHHVHAGLDDCKTHHSATRATSHHCCPLESDDELGSDTSYDGAHPPSPWGDSHVFSSCGSSLDPSACPSGLPHDCHEARCAYMPSSLATTDWEKKLPQALASPAIRVYAVHAFRSQHYMNSDAWPARSSTSSVRCILLQSWQI
ncbi:hypothetical protein Q31a_39370 [Aureliella helgolandensis]|uniref:Uncharacterized protein n=1 Tax=Aureliella helgolandensis TaxID=2527968 RepID=A0A518GAJ5_9BACT|nr:hypothetical protein Q31a_39370 [Aureliella helgolandensis]